MYELNFSNMTGKIFYCYSRNYISRWSLCLVIYYSFGSFTHELIAMTWILMEKCTIQNNSSSAFLKIIKFPIHHLWQFHSSNFLRIFWNRWDHSLQRRHPCLLPIDSPPWWMRTKSWFWVMEECRRKAHIRSYFRTQIHFTRIYGINKIDCHKFNNETYQLDCKGFWCS